MIFTRLYELTRNNVYQYLRKYTNDTHLIEDLMQQCYIKVWERLDTIRDIGEALPLLKTYARNLLIDVVRRRMKEDLKWLEMLREEAESILSDHVSRDGEKRLQVLDIAIRRLPDNCKKVYLFHREEGMSYKEISSRLSISVSMVEKYMSKAIRLLKQELLSDGSLLLMVIAAHVARECC